VTISQSISWTDIAREASEHLGHIVAHGTSTGPYYELPAARYLLSLFEKEGIPAVILPPGAGNLSVAGKQNEPASRANLVAHIPGNDAGEPLLLLSHLDSVRTETLCPDLPGRSPDDTIRGAGSLMGTHLSVAHAMALILLSRSGTRLNRTIRYAATSGGSDGSGSGLRVLAENHLEHITSECAIGWGAFSWRDETGRLYSLLSDGEKGVLKIVLRSEGTGGSAGVRVKRDPVSRMIKAIEALDELTFDAKPSRGSIDFVNSISPAIKDINIRALLEDLNGEGSAPKALEAISLEPSIDPALAMYLRSLVTTEQTVVRVETVGTGNMRPTVAEAEVNYLYPPGEDVERLAMKVVEALRADGVYLAEKSHIEPSGSEISCEAQALAKAALNEVDPDAVLVTGLAPWPSGLESLRKYGTSVYGWEPFASGGSMRDTLGTRGGPNERIEIDDLAREIRTIYSFLLRMTC